MYFRFEIIISTYERVIKTLPKAFKYFIPTKPKRTGKGCVSSSGGMRRLRR
jgi:hypothetical protein